MALKGVGVQRVSVNVDEVSVPRRVSANGCGQYNRSLVNGVRLMPNTPRKSRSWIVTPLGIAVFVFLVFAPGFWLRSLLVRTEEFLAAPIQDILCSTIVGLTLSIWAYTRVKKWLHQREHQSE